MPGNHGRDETGRPRSEDGARLSEADLARRRADLESGLASRGVGQPAPVESKPPAGYGQAVKLSSEFIAGVAVGAAIGWGIDYLAGTSPWGLIVFLLLGFGAGVLNVMRSAGMVAQARFRDPPK